MSYCVCGHPEEAHLFGGRCRVPGCTCDRFWPIPEISAQMWSRLMRTRGIQKDGEGTETTSEFQSPGLDVLSTAPNFFRPLREPRTAGRSLSDSTSEFFELGARGNPSRRAERIAKAIGAPVTELLK